MSAEGDPTQTSAKKVPVPVEQFAFAFRAWDGEIGPWREHFGKARGQVYPLDGAAPARSCHEVEIAKKLRTVRQHTFWFSQYQPRLIPDLWRPWVRSLGEQSPDWLTGLDEYIRAEIRSLRGGMPDVVACDDNALKTAVFVECKALKEAQEDWAAAARQAGIEGASWRFLCADKLRVCGGKRFIPTSANGPELPDARFRRQLSSVWTLAWRR